MSKKALPTAFVWRRLHSLSGVWLVIFLISHLLTNSQAALWIGDDGSGFVHAVEAIHNLPYLQAIELTLLAGPFLLHMFWGLHYLFTAKPNSSSSDGSEPSLPEYPRNRTYTWMRLTSWLLLFGIIFHVVQMRFIEYPWSASKDGKTFYMTVLNVDGGLYTVSERLGVVLYDNNKIHEERSQLQTRNKDNAFLATTPPLIDAGFGWLSGPQPETFNLQKSEQLKAEQALQEHYDWVEALMTEKITPKQVVAVAPDFGTVELLIVRETFKSPLMVALYSLLVLAACFHGFNGLWTFLITWGIALTERSQHLARLFTTALMVLIASLGLAACIGTYWINLAY